MTKDEISLLGTYLQRDLEHLIHFVDETGEGLAEWLQLDLSLLEHRLTERLLSVADQTLVDTLALKQNSKATKPGSISPVKLQQPACSSA